MHCTVSIFSTLYFYLYVEIYSTCDNLSEGLLCFVDVICLMFYVHDREDGQYESIHPPRCISAPVEVDILALKRLCRHQKGTFHLGVKMC